MSNHNNQTIIREPAIGKGMAGALKFLQNRGQLKETVELAAGQNTDNNNNNNKSSKHVVHNYGDGPGQKEIRIDRTDEYGRILGPKENFRVLSHAFHNIKPGKNKQEKRRRKYEEELKAKKMDNADTPLISVQRMREAQEKLKSPYLVLSGSFFKPGGNTSSTGAIEGSNNKRKRKAEFQGLRNTPKTKPECHHAVLPRGVDGT